MHVFLIFRGFLEESLGECSCLIIGFSRFNGLSCILLNLSILFSSVVNCISADYVIVFVYGRVPRTVHVLYL